MYYCASGCKSCKIESITTDNNNVMNMMKQKLATEGLRSGLV